jgi:hypothetical protein
MRFPLPTLVLLSMISMPAIALDAGQRVSTPKDPSPNFNRVVTKKIDLPDGPGGLVLGSKSLSDFLPNVTDSGDMMLLPGRKIGRVQDGKFISQPDVVQIQGPGSTGDVSATTVLPSDGTAAKSLSAWTGSLSALLSRQAVNALEYVSPVAILAGNDVAPQLRQAVAAAQNTNRPLILPGFKDRCYRIDSTVDTSSVEVMGQKACIVTSAAINMITADTDRTQIHDLQINHNGSAGSIFRFDKSHGHEVYNVRGGASSSSNPDPLIYFVGSNVYIHDNKLDNCRPNAYAWKYERIDPSLLAINSVVRENYFGCTGKGGWIGDNGLADRPEGILVAGNRSVLTGGPFVTVSSLLHGQFSDNMMDAAPGGTGSVLIAPAGHNNAGIDGLIFSANYIAAPTSPSGPAVQNRAGVNGAPATGIKFIGNYFGFGTNAAKFVPGISAEFVANHMAGGSAGHCIELTSASLLATVRVGSVDQCPGKNLVFVTGSSQAGSVRSEQVVTYGAPSGAGPTVGYALVAHGLAAKPTKFKTGVSTVGTGGAQLTGASVMVVGVDEQNVTLAVTTTGVAVAGNLWITLESEI